MAQMVRNLLAMQETWPWDPAFPDSSLVGAGVGVGLGGSENVTQTSTCLHITGVFSEA